MRLHSLLFTVLLCGQVCLAQPTAKQWNSEVTAGWNLGNQFECSATHKSMEIGLPDNSTKHPGVTPR